MAAVELLSLLLLLLVVVVKVWLWPEESSKRPPGPAGLPVLGNLRFFLRSRLLYRDLAGLEKEFGPIIWLRMASKPVVAVQSAAIAEELLRMQDLVFADRPPPGYALQQLRYPTEITFAPHGHTWRLARKFLTLELLSMRRIGQFAEGREEELRCAVAGMRHAWLGRGPGDGDAVLVNMHTRVRAITVNSVSQVLLRKRLVSYEGRHDDDEEVALELDGGGQGITDGLCENYITSCHVKFVRDIFPGLGFLDDIFFRDTQRRLKEMFRKMDTVVQEMLDSRRAHLDQPPRDLADVIAGLAQEDGTALPDDELKALLALVLLGAPHNAAVVVEWVLAELLNHPQALRKVQLELDEVVGRERRVEESDVAQLPYLQAVLKEGMRLHPALPMLVPRCARQDTTLGGYHIPAGTKVLLNVWSMQRNPAVWERAEEFWPERFLAGGSAAHIDSKGLHFDLLPFGSGRRICPGMNLGVVLTHQVLARMLQSFDWKLPEGQKVDMSEMMDIAAKLKAPLKALISPRLPDYLY